MPVKKHFTTLILRDTILPITTLKLKLLMTTTPQYLFWMLLTLILKMNQRKP